MQARRRHLVEPAKPGNVDRRKAFMDILERLAFGVTTVAVSPAYRAAAGIHGAPRTVSHKARPRRS
jgi:triphosphoribosyl-dephospho-CoA synthetase